MRSVRFREGNHPIMSLIHLSTLRGVGPCSTAALLSNLPKKWTNKNQQRLVSLFLQHMFPTKLYQNSYWRTETSSGINIIWPKMSLPRTKPSTLGDAWGIMKIPAIARLEGLKVKNPWTKNDIFNLAPLCPLLVKLCYSSIRSAIFSCHILSPKNAKVPSLCLQLAVDICTSSSSRPWSHWSIADNLTTGFLWVQIWSKYNETRGNLKAARIAATMNSQLWHMHLWWILWLVWYCPCLAHSYFWFDFGLAPGSNSLKCAAIASWKARIHALMLKSNQEKQFFSLHFLNFFLSESKKHAEKGWVFFFPDSFM